MRVLFCKAYAGLKTYYNAENPSIVIVKTLFKFLKVLACIIWSYPTGQVQNLFRSVSNHKDNSKLKKVCVHFKKAVVFEVIFQVKKLFPTFLNLNLWLWRSTWSHSHDILVSTAVNFINILRGCFLYESSFKAKL